MKLNVDDMILAALKEDITSEDITTTLLCLNISWVKLN